MRTAWNMRGDDGRGPPVQACPLVRTGFVVLVVLFLGLGIVTLLRMLQMQRDTRALIGDMVQSIDLVSEMGRDADRERLLLDEHIFERAPARMRRLETEMETVQANFWRTAAAYEPLATLPGEADAWNKLQRDLAAVREPVFRTLEFSRKNRDVEAYAARQELNEPFQVIDADVKTLVRINRDGADRIAARMSSQQRGFAWFVAVFGAAGVAISVLVGTAVSRVVRSRETRMQDYSRGLETRNHELDAFAGRVAHDLRGPLTTLSFAAGHLKQRAAREEGSIAILDRAVGRMERLIDDLLTLSRLGGPQAESVGDPSRAAAEVREEMATRATAEEAAFDLHVDPVPVRCPPGLLRQALFNLVDNAVKYRRPGVPAEVQIDGHRSGGQYELVVRDNGLGMSAEQTSRIFEPFYRAVQVRDMPGTGLGLSIVKRIAEATGGTARVDSQPGRGSRFVVTLPVARGAAPTAG